jgi:hypothetical protein
MTRQKVAWARASLRYLAALAVIVGCCGLVVVCPKRLYLVDGARPGFVWQPLDPFDRRGPRDYFFRLQAFREGGRTIVIAPFYVYPGPFSFQGVGGISNLDLVDESTDAIACFELFEEGFFGDPLHTVDLCGRYTNGGYQAFNSENQDQRFYPAVYLLEFLVEYDGDDLGYWTRPVGAPTWDLVTSVPFAFDSRLIPSMGALNLHKKGVYDLRELTWTLTPPAAPTAEEASGWHIQEAYRFDFSALEKLEGDAPDFAGATADLGSARSELSLALDETPDFIDAKIGKQVVRYVTRADKRLERAQQEAIDEDADGAVSQLLKSLREQGNGFQGIFQLDFRELF